MRNNANPLLWRLVPGTMLVVDPVLLKVEQPVPGMQSDRHAGSLSPLVAATVSGKQLRSLHEPLKDSVTPLS